MMRLKKAPRGNDKMNKISDQIKSGSRAFLSTEYMYLGVFVICAFIALVILYSVDPPSGERTDGIRYGGCFLAGALLSAAAGWGGMSVATDANVRTTQAADKEGLAKALRVAFTGGAVMGFTVVGLGLLGLTALYALVSLGYTEEEEKLGLQFVFAAEAIAGFGFGASSIALFARVAGGVPHRLRRRRTPTGRCHPCRAGLRPRRHDTGFCGSFDRSLHVRRSRRGRANEGHRQVLRRQRIWLHRTRRRRR